MHVHGLRHSFAVESIRRGVKINVLSKVLGHANSGITWRYVFQLSPIMGRHTHVLGVAPLERMRAGSDRVALHRRRVDARPLLLHHAVDPELEVVEAALGALLVGELDRTG